jgi:hypothetical protein
MSDFTAVQIDPNKLHKLLVAHFSLDELRTLCFALNLEFDELPPSGKSAKARGLVEMCQRLRRLVELAEELLVQRPKISSTGIFHSEDSVQNDVLPSLVMLRSPEASL